MDVAALDDGVLASAYNGAVTVLQSEIQDEFDNMLSQYVAYYAQYGYNVDEYDTDLQASVAQETVQSKLSTAIVRHYAAENGYELTEEKKAELAAQVQTTLDNTREYLGKLSLRFRLYRRRADAGRGGSADAGGLFRRKPDGNG